MKRMLSGTLAFSIASGAITSPFFSSQAYAQVKPTTIEHTASSPIQKNGNVHLFDYRDPDTKELIRFEYEPSSREHLKKFAPSKVRTMITGIPPAAPGGLKGIAKQFAYDFPAEYVAFTTAMLITSSIFVNNDPASMKHFIDQNLKDPVAYVSFAGFLAGNRAAHSALKAMGIAYDPSRAPLNYQLLRPSAAGVDGVARPVPMRVQVIGSPQGPTRPQRMFAPLLGPIGLAAGMTVSNVIHEVLADPLIRQCAKARMDKEVTTAQADEICDEMWEEWAFSKKAVDYTPGILAMGGAALVQAYLINKPIVAAASATKGAVQRKLQATVVKAGSERYVPIVLRSVRIAGHVGNLASGPAGRFVLTVGNIAIFMGLVEWPTKVLTQWIEKPRQGKDNTERINSLFTELNRAEKNNWNWQPRPDSDFCPPHYVDPLSQNIAGAGYFVDPEAAYLNAFCTPPEQPSPKDILKKMAQRQAKWREFILQDAYMAHSNWLEYVGGFATMYANAAAFYEQVISHIGFQRHDPRAKQNTSYLYLSDPTYGIYADGDSANNHSEAKIQATNQARAWLSDYLEKAKTSKRRMHSTEQIHLPEILKGLNAIDMTMPIESIAPAAIGFLNLKGMTEEQRAEFEARIRERLLTDAIKTLRKVLETDLVYSDKHLSLNSELYAKLANGGNPFMKLRMLLGNPDPTPAGVAFIREANNDEYIIDQDSKANHPAGIGRAATNSMADFLVASMVCGPDADPQYSDAQKIQIYKSRKFSTFERLLDRVGLGRRSIQASDREVMIAVQEHIAEKTKSERSWFPRWGQNSVVTEFAGFSADFRPPRIVSGVPADLCSKFADNSNRDRVWFDIHTARWTINGERFNGILDIVRRKARTDIVGTSLPPETVPKDWQSPFNAWWTQHVDSHVHLMVEKFRVQYKQVLQRDFIPALTQTGKEFTKRYNGRDFKLGALDALYDEVDLYLDVLAKTAKLQRETAAQREFENIAGSIRLAFRDMSKIVTDLDFVEAKGEVASAAFDAKRMVLDEKLKELGAWVSNQEQAAQATESAKEINEQTLKNMNGLMGEMDSYWGIIRTVQIVGQ
jgi:hypothetical protein